MVTTNETPDQIVDRYIRTATTERDRLIAEMASTYRQRAEYWEREARNLRAEIAEMNIEKNKKQGLKNDCAST